MKLELASAALPTLLTDCVLVGHARKADVVFIARQFVALCVHMLNENPPNFFLKAYRDKEGKPRFSKSFKPDFEQRTRWAWDTITARRSC
jgi:hypothetical protein